jgi:hypothetical protein
MIHRTVELAEPLIVAVCERIKQWRPHQVFHTKGDPYLDRCYIFRRAWVREAIPRDVWWRLPDGVQSWLDRPPLPSIYLHYFYRGDLDQALHNHPWGWAFSLILTNGYHEERWTAQGRQRSTFRPGSFNILRWNTYHRVDLRDPSKGAWTLFITSPRVQDWSFWESERGTAPVLHREFIAAREWDARQSYTN